MEGLTDSNLGQGINALHPYYLFNFNGYLTLVTGTELCPWKQLYMLTAPLTSSPWQYNHSFLYQWRWVVGIPLQ